MKHILLTLLDFNAHFASIRPIVTYRRGHDRQPGLVLGLRRGGMCEGMAFRIGSGLRDITVRYLRMREQIGGVYRESEVQVEIRGRSGSERAITYVVETAHPNYAGHLPFRQQVQIIRSARGRSGPNVEYLINASMHLRNLSLRDRNLERLATAVGGFFASSFNESQALYRRSASLVATNKSLVRAGPKLRPHERRRFLYRNRLRKTEREIALLSTGGQSLLQRTVGAVYLQRTKQCLHFYLPFFVKNS